MSLNTIDILKKLFASLKFEKRIYLLGMIILSIFSGLMEMISLGSLVPFLAILSDPNVIWNNTIVRSISSTFGINNPNEFILPFTIIFCLAAIVSGLIRLLNIWLAGKLAASIGTDLSTLSYGAILNQEYSDYLSRKSSSLMSTITNNIPSTVSVLNQLILLINGIFVFSAILFTLLIINPFISSLCILLFGLFYLIIVLVTKNILAQNSKFVVEKNSYLIKLIQEGVGSIRNILLDQTQDFYLSEFSTIDKPMRLKYAQNNFLASSPRYLMESFGLVTLGLFSFILVMRKGDFTSLIPILGALALGAQRLLPALQQIYTAWASIKSNSKAVENVLNTINSINVKSKKFKLNKAFKFTREIKFDSICYSYPNSKKELIKNLSLEIIKGQKIGFIGTTGEGKSTIIDLLMGFLKPLDGQIIIDGKNINSSEDLIKSWRLNISHVPQDIFLADRTIAENIAFGIKKNYIDFKRVEKVAKLAQIHSFIKKTKYGYFSPVGEQGIQLSGGQKQRIAIARALYKKADVLIFDEATSALDKNTENNIFKILDNLNENLTLIIITHRLDTLKICDNIFEIKGGKISNSFSGSEIDRLYPK